MKKYFLINLCFINLFAAAQNLIPNGDFEQYNNCPVSAGQLINATFWTNPGGWSPDFMDSCAMFPINVPDCTYGYQVAFNGGGMGGISLWSPALTEFREYMQTTLDSTLIAGNCYDFKMWINAGEGGIYGADAIGAYFSNTPISGMNTIYTVTPQINYTGGMITDTANWILVSGFFIAAGGENYLIIGNFKDDAATNTTNLNGLGIYNIAYVYIDGVSLTPCISGIEEQKEKTTINVLPNPFNDRLSLTINNNQLSSFILYDISSRKIVETEFINSVSINTEWLAKGIYVYKIKNKNGVMEQGKLIKE